MKSTSEKIPHFQKQIKFCHPLYFLSTIPIPKSNAQFLEPPPLKKKNLPCPLYSHITSEILLQMSEILVPEEGGGGITDQI